LVVDHLFGSGDAYWVELRGVKSDLGKEADRAATRPVGSATLQTEPFTPDKDAFSGGEQEA
jgi:hypothetical protein